MERVCGEGLSGAQVHPDEWEWVSVGYLHIAGLRRTKEMGTPSSGCSWQRGVSRFKPNLHSWASVVCVWGHAHTPQTAAISAALSIMCYMCDRFSTHVHCVIRVYVFTICVLHAACLLIHMYLSCIITVFVPYPPSILIYTTYCVYCMCHIFQMPMSVRCVACHI